MIWVGTDDGNVQVTRDGGKSWTNPDRPMSPGCRGSRLGDIDRSRGVTSTRGRPTRSSTSTPSATCGLTSTGPRISARPGPRSCNPPPPPRGAQSVAMPTSSKKTLSTRTCCSSAPSLNSGSRSTLKSASEGAVQGRRSAQRRSSMRPGDPSARSRPGDRHAWTPASGLSTTSARCALRAAETLGKEVVFLGANASARRVFPLPEGG